MLNPFRWPFRVQYAAGFMVCAGLLAFAYYEQFALGVEPCPMCIFQRIAYIAMAIVFVIGAIHGPGNRGRRVYAILVFLTACIGAGIAVRHVWIQHQPPDLLAGCAPGWNYMVANFPLGKTLRMAFTGSADCSTVSWTLFGLSMPVWSLFSFVLLGSGGLWAGWHRRSA